MKRKCEQCETIHSFKKSDIKDYDEPIDRICKRMLIYSEYKNQSRMFGKCIKCPACGDNNILTRIAYQK